MAIDGTDDLMLLGHRKHWQRNKDQHGKDGLDGNPEARELGSEMMEEALNALLPIIVKYSLKIKEATSKSDLVEDYTCSHLTAVWLAKHLEVAPQILVECLAGYGMGMGDSTRSISRAMGYGENSSGNLKKKYPKITEIKEAVSSMMEDSAFDHFQHVFELDDGFGGSFRFILRNPKVENLDNGYIRIPLS